MGILGNINIIADFLLYVYLGISGYAPKNSLFAKSVRQMSQKLKMLERTNSWKKNKSKKSSYTIYFFFLGFLNWCSIQKV